MPLYYGKVTVAFDPADLNEVRALNDARTTYELDNADYYSRRNTDTFIGVRGSTDVTSVLLNAMSFADHLRTRGFNVTFVGTTT